MAMRWARQPSETGLARVTQGPRGYELREGGKAQMCVAVLGRDTSRWYWYGHGRNTSGEPVATADEAKAQAMAHYKAVRAAKAREPQE